MVQIDISLVLLPVRSRPGDLDVLSSSFCSRIYDIYISGTKSHLYPLLYIFSVLTEQRRFLYDIYISGKISSFILCFTHFLWPQRNGVFDIKRYHSIEVPKVGFSLS